VLFVGVAKGALLFVAQSGKRSAQLLIGVALNVRFEPLQGGRIVLFPRECLPPDGSRLLHRARFVNGFQQSEAFRTGSWIVSKHSCQPQAIHFVTRIARTEITKLGNRFLASSGTGGFGLIKSLGPPSRRRCVAEDLPVDLHRLVGLALHGQPAGFIQLLDFLRRHHVHLLDGRDGGVVGIDFAQTIEIPAQPVGITVLLREPRQADQGFRLIWIDQKDLIPILRRQIRSPPRLERARLAQKNLDAVLRLGRQRNRRQSEHKCDIEADESVHE
jgi:hypothetical protein